MDSVSGLQLNEKLVAISSILPTLIASVAGRNEQVVRIGSYRDMDAIAHRPSGFDRSRQAAEQTAINDERIQS